MDSKMSNVENEYFVLETKLNAEEKEIIRQGREEYKQGGFIPLDQIS